MVSFKSDEFLIFLGKIWQNKKTWNSAVNRKLYSGTVTASQWEVDGFAVKIHSEAFVRKCF